MLISKSSIIEAGDIVTFKLVNGDEIVAKIDNNDGKGDFQVSRPCVVVPSGQGIGLMQAMFSAEINTIITLKSEHIMMYAPTVKDLEAHYLKTTTGIELLPKGKIIA
jgi:hypothetical protein